MKYPIHYDVLVVGGGHAGVEAACAAARMGARTLLLTHNIETIGQMSCNPAIGGIGKGHLVKEIDALGGIMARAADRAGIQWRILNRRKGPAVRATRAQADRILYKAAVREIVENQPNLDIFQTPVTDLILEGTRIAGVKSQHQIDYYATATVLTAGTFLGGKIHVGLNSFTGGRAGDPPANELAARLHDLPFALARMKTGTPPRLDARTVDYSRMEAQPGDTPLPVFSYLGNAAEHPRQVACHITRTNERTHDIIRAYIDQAPMYAGVIKDAFGPRYCPSIEDKVMRFADKDSHQIFIEPESLTTNELYPNGVSTSLPFAAQIAYIQTIPGLEQARITRPGYAIEYDYFDPQHLKHSLESRAIEPLSLRTNQRHHRLRRSGRTRPARRHQRRPPRARPRTLVPRTRTGLPRRPHRRPHHPGHTRTLPHVHQPRRTPPAAARRQRRRAPDRHRPCARRGGRTPLPHIQRKNRSSRARTRAPAPHPHPPRTPARPQPKPCGKRVAQTPGNRLRDPCRPARLRRATAR